MALGLPVSYLFTIPLSTLGGGVIAGAYWLAVGYLLANRSIERRAAAQTIVTY